MKNYYNRLSREEQKEIKKEIKNSKKWDIYKRINIYSILTYVCLLFIVSDIYFNYYTKGAKYNYIIDVVIIVMLVMFYYKLIKTKDDVLNKFALEKKEK